MPTDGSAHLENGPEQKYYDEAYEYRERQRARALTMVRVAPDDSTAVRYLVDPFADVADLPFASVSLNLDWKDYSALGEEQE